MTTLLTTRSELTEQTAEAKLANSFRAASGVAAHTTAIVDDPTELQALQRMDGADILTFGLAVGKARLAVADALRPHGITALGVTPGFLSSKAMLIGFGATEDTWRDAAAQDPHFLAFETPGYVGRAVSALATDPHVHTKTNRVLTSWDPAEEDDLHDVDGSRPHWSRHFATQVLPNAI